MAESRAGGPGRRGQAELPAADVVLRRVFYSVLARQEILDEAEAQLGPHEAGQRRDAALLLERAMYSFNAGEHQPLLCDGELLQVTLLLGAGELLVPLRVQFLPARSPGHTRSHEARFALVYQMSRRGTQRLQLRRGHEPRLRSVELRYLEEEQVLVARVLDRRGRPVVGTRDVQYVFTRNDCESYCLAVPALDLLEHRVREHGVFRVEAVCGGRRTASEAVYCRRQPGGGAVVVPPRPVAAAAGGAPAARGRQLAYRRPARPRAGPRRARVVTEPERPVYIEHTCYTDTANTRYEAVVRFFVPLLQHHPDFYIFDQYRGDVFYQSPTDVLHEKVDDRTYRIHFRFQAADVGSFPHLLVQDKVLQFYQPLTYTAVKPDLAFKPVYDRIADPRGSPFTLPATLILPESGRLEYATLDYRCEENQLLVYASDTNEVLADLAPDATEPINPCCFYTGPRHHPIALLSTKLFHDCEVFDQELSFEEGKFFTYDFWDVVCANDERKAVMEETNTHLVVKLGQRFFILSFGDTADQQTAQLVFLRYKGLLYPGSSVNQEYRELICQVQRFSKEALYKNYNRKNERLAVVRNETVRLYERLDVERLDEGCKVVVAALDDENVTNVLRYRPGLVLDNRFGYRGAELFAYTGSAVQHTLLADNLVPADTTAVEAVVQRQKRRRVTYRCNVVDLRGRAVRGALAQLHQDRFSIGRDKKTDEADSALVLLRPTHYSELRAAFTGLNSFLVFGCDGAWEIEVADDLDYLEIMSFFGK